MNKSRVFALILISTMMIGVLSPFASAFVIPPGTQEYTIYPTFRFVLLTPSPNPVRQQWAQLVTNNLVAMGVQAERVIAGWDIIYARALSAAEPERGENYDNGGFDSLFVGYAVSPDPNPTALFDSTQFTPDGQNYYLWNDSYVDEISLNITKEFDFAKRMTLLKDFQSYFYEVLPETTICYTKEVVGMALNVNSTPFTLYHYPLWCPAEQWRYTDNQTTMVLAQTGKAPTNGLSPWHTTSYYDLTAYGPVYGEGGGWGLTMRDTGFTPQPYLAYNNISWTSDHLRYNVTLRSEFWSKSVLFHDGQYADGRDFVVTLRAALSPAFGGNVYSYIKTILGTDVAGYGNKSVWYAGEKGTRGENWTLNYNKIGFALPKAWVYFDPDILGTLFFPAHVLCNYTTYDWTNGNRYLVPNSTTLARWRTLSFNTGLAVPYAYYNKTNNGIMHYTGPLGLGPYKFVAYDSTTETVKLQKFNNYFRKAALEATGAYKIVDFWVRWISGSTAALGALSTGDVDVLDSQYKLESNLAAIDPSWGKYVVYLAWGLQEFGFNMQHPVVGTGVNTPLGQAVPARAAEAAIHVRHAIDYLVPKDYICKVMLNGFATFGTGTAVLPQMNGGSAYNTALVLRNETDSAKAKFAAMEEFKAAGYNFVPVIPASFWDTYGLLLSVVELAVVVVLAGFILYRLRAPVK